MFCIAQAQFMYYLKIMLSPTHTHTSTNFCRWLTVPCLFFLSSLRLSSCHAVTCAVVRCAAMVCRAALCVAATSPSVCASTTPRAISSLSNYFTMSSFLHDYFFGFHVTSFSYIEKLLAAPSKYIKFLIWKLKHVQFSLMYKWHWDYYIDEALSCQGANTESLSDLDAAVCFLIFCDYFSCFIYRVAYWFLR